MEAKKEFLISLMKKYYSQGDGYNAYQTKKGSWVVSYSNDYPMQHGNGERITIPDKMVDVLMNTSQSEVIRNCTTCRWWQNDKCISLAICAGFSKWKEREPPLTEAKVSDDEIIESTYDYCALTHLNELVFDSDEFVSWYRTHAQDPQKLKYKYSPIRSELYKRLKESNKTLRSVMLSMAAHPDYVTGRNIEFTDYVSICEEAIEENTELLSRIEHAQEPRLTEAKVVEILEKFADKDWQSISNTDFEAIAKALTGKEKV